MDSERARELTRSELETLPENRLWLSGAEVVYVSAYGTWEGHGFDGFNLSASLDRYFVGPYRFEAVVGWYQNYLASLGWPDGSAVKSADRTAWHRWRWALESVDLIDRVIQAGDPLAAVPAKWRGQRLQSELPAGSWIWSVTYDREPPPGKKRPASMTPPSEDEQFDKTFLLLEEFVKREGHADVPLEHVADGVHIGVWVSNLRYQQANTELRPDWAARLAALPGWKWLSGSDFFLVERYAKREGHTRMPADYVDEGRPIGEWAKQMRRMHASDQLAPETSARIERIPFWEW